MTVGHTSLTVSTSTRYFPFFSVFTFLGFGSFFLIYSAIERHRLHWCYNRKGPKAAPVTGHGYFCVIAQTT